MHDDPAMPIDRASIAPLALADMTNTPSFTPSRRVIEILAFADAQLLDISGPLQVFASANTWAKESGKPLPYQIRVAAEESPVLTNSGLAILAEALPMAASPLDTLIVAGGWGVHAACITHSNCRMIRNSRICTRGCRRT
jgi:transcriptional regulator GlxA family with amidase domain